MRYLPPLSWLGILKLLRDAQYEVSRSCATRSLISCRFPSWIDILKACWLVEVLSKAIVRLSPTFAFGSGC